MSKFAVILPLIFAAACGASGPPAESPKPAPVEKPTSQPADEDKAADDADTHVVAKKSEAKPADDGPKVKLSAQDILTASDVVFMFSFKDSDVKQSAESKCTASAGNDPKKLNACLAKAHTAIDVDGYRFKQADGKWWWLTLRTRGKVLHTLHKFEIDFGPEKDGSVVIKPKGKDLGSAHGRTPGDFTIEVPNSYQIVLNDPKLGKLVYEAKIGIASE